MQRLWYYNLSSFNTTDVLLIRLYQIYIDIYFKIAYDIIETFEILTLFISERFQRFCPPYRESKFSVDTTSCVRISP
jgi:hypothetical protein